ncbi:MAG TPA: T9SS type A sorting domain-containing protein [Chryseosolibacter sp.]|nr:T9SS type A sorting domain-containing protein [Chryseosolibacter sp.]
MRQALWLIFLCFVTLEVSGQSFDVGPLQDVYKGFIGETVKVPIQLTNQTDKPLTLVVRRVSSSLGGTQKNYFCLDNNCLEQRIEDVLVRIEPHETLTNFQIALEAGLANGASSAKFLVFNRYNSSETFEFDLHFAVEERSGKEDVYTSPHIILHDIYPNPVVDFAYVNYDMISDKVEAKIIIHNILGNPIDEYSLPSAENKVKIRAESMNAGIYFYTLYLDNEGVVTRKLIVKK